MRHLDEDQVARQHAIAVPDHLHQGRRAVVERIQRLRRHDQSVALHEEGAGAMFIDQFAHGHPVFRLIGGEGRLAAPAPGRHDREDRKADQQRNEAAFKEFQRTRDQKPPVDRRQGAPDQAGLQPSPAPDAAGDEKHRQRSDDHDAGNREAVGRGQRRRRAEGEDQHDAAAEQSPVDEGHVNLPGMGGMGVQDVDAGKQAEPHGLQGQRKGAGNQRLRGDDGGDRRQQPPSDRARAAASGCRTAAPGQRRAAQQIGALPQIIEKQRRKNDGEPAEPGSGRRRNGRDRRTWPRRR